ncbi:major facilitator superfamily domain-containing protein [Diaporthe sp. PMI_573]|nr:major facilitator superfamily domain-containing protein [Diaporthaceae sp. PMI_573]
MHIPAVLSETWLETDLIAVLGGVFTQQASWRWCFYINLPISGGAMVILFFALHLHNPRTGVKEGLAAIDWLGSLTIVGGTLMILLGLEFGGVTFPWDSPAVICLIVFGAVLVGVFFLVELRVAKIPVIPLRIFKQPSNLAVVGLSACHGFVFISASYYLPLYFQGVLGADPLLSGVYVLPFTFIMGAASAVTGFVIKKTGKYLPAIIFGFVFMTLGYGLFIDLDPYENWAKIVIFQIILGLGVGPNFQSPLIALQTTVQPKDIASATATYGFVRQVATSMSVVIGGVIFQNEMQKQYPILINQLGPEVAGLLSGSNAASSVEAVAALPQPEKGVAQRAYFNAIRIMFIFYVAFAGLGLVLSFFVGSRKLSKEHTEHKTGLQTLQPARGPAADEEKAAGGAGAGTAAGDVTEESRVGETPDRRQ